MLDLSRVRTYPIAERRNLVKRSDFVLPDHDTPVWGNRRFRSLVRRIEAARSGGHAVILMMGAHVVKCGLSLLVIDLMEKRFITHVAGNGAVSIHDFEMALIGETSEDVPRSIDDGSFGMADETGRMMNEAINGSRMGYGMAVGRYILERSLPFPELSIQAAAARLGVPMTIHVAIGTDVIHQHPTCDGAKLGRATYEDFRTFTESVAGAANGVILNFGSAVIMPEVFLKALTISRNLGYPVAPITTANFELRAGINDYYYRPSKNVVKRPTQRGGRGYNFRVDHRVSVPSLHRLLTGGGND